MNNTIKDEKIYIMVATIGMMKQPNVLKMVASLQLEHPTHQLILITKDEIPPFTSIKQTIEPFIITQHEMLMDYSDILLTKQQRIIRRNNRFRSNQHNFTNSKLKQYKRQ